LRESDDEDAIVGGVAEGQIGEHIFMTEKENGFVLRCMVGYGWRRFEAMNLANSLSFLFPIISFSFSVFVVMREKERLM